MSVLRRLSLLSLTALLSLTLSLPVFAQGDGDDAGNTTTPDPLGGATEFATLDEPTDVRLMLDWTANTNHTGFYVAQTLGYYDEANLNVEIIEPTDIFPENALDSGIVDFGVGFQDFSTPAMAAGADIVSIAAMIQSNTSGFATLAEQQTLESPADLAGLDYGGFGFVDLENAILNTFLACDNASWDNSNYIETQQDVIELMARERVDFGWIFYGWQGINAELDGRELSRLMLMDYPECIPNYYTPILLTSSSMIEENPDVVRAFVHATARGFAYAITSPAEAAEILLEAVPELDDELVRASADYLADEYQGNAPRWGQQTAATWQNFSAFLVENGIVEEFDPEGFWTNDFLPGDVPSTSDAMDTE